MMPWTFNCLQHSTSVTPVRPDTQPGRVARAVIVLFPLTGKGVEVQKSW